jgi:hypothetical protein
MGLDPAGICTRSPGRPNRVREADVDCVPPPVPLGGGDHVSFWCLTGPRNPRRRDRLRTHRRCRRSADARSPSVGREFGTGAQPHLTEGRARHARVGEVMLIDCSPPSTRTVCRIEVAVKRESRCEVCARPRRPFREVQCAVWPVLRLGRGPAGSRRHASPAPRFVSLVHAVSETWPFAT